MPRPVRHATGGSSNKGIFKPQHQSMCPPTSDRPRLWLLNPLQAPSGLWNGNLTYTDFELDQNIGVAKSFYLQETINFSDPTHLPSCPSTWHQLQRVEIYIGSDLVETVFADSLYHESLAFLREQDAHNVADIHNVRESDLGQRNMYVPTTAQLTAADQAAGYIGYEESRAGALGPVRMSYNINALNEGEVTQTSSGYYYVNLDNTCLKAMKPYVRGFNAKIKIRCYWNTTWSAQYQVNVLGVAPAPSATPPVVGTATTFYVSNPSIGSLQLFVEEETTDSASLIALEQAHRAGIVDYTCIVRERLQDNPPNLVGGQQNTTYLRAFRNKACGILPYLTVPNPPADRLQQRLAFASFQLLDQRGNKLTEILSNDILTSKVFPDQIDSSFPNSAQPDIRTIVVVPFSKHMQPALDQGCSNGSFQLTTLEQLVLIPDGTSATVAGTVNANGETTSCGVNMLTVISYSYAHVTVMAGQHSIRFE